MFAGAYSFSGDKNPKEIVDIDDWKTALFPRAKPETFGHLSADKILLAEGGLTSSSETLGEKSDLPKSSGDLTIAFWGRLDNRASLISQLKLSEEKNHSDRAILLEGWRQWGRALPEKLIGDFAFAIFDSAKQELFLARDPLGVKPLYYWASKNNLLFSTSSAAFRVLKDSKPTPDPDWIARFINGVSMSFDSTAYIEVKKVPPGHSLFVDRSGESQLRKWHEWKDDAPFATERDPKWVEEYREILEESIRCRMTGEYPIATENSGGIDSATITAYLAKFIGTPGDKLHAFSLCRTEKEPGYILETSQRSGIEHNYIRTAGSGSMEDGVRRLRSAIKILGYPGEHGNGAGYVPFYKECELRGIRTLHSGYGGDEVVTNPGRQLRLELIDSKNFRAFWGLKQVKNPLRRVLSLGKIMAIGRENLEFPRYAEEAFNKGWSWQILNPDVAEKIGLYKTMRERAKFDAPYRKINDWILNGLLKMPYVPTRLEDCTLMAAAYGIDYRWALWDVRLVQQYLSTPSIEKLGPNNMGRYLHRRAIVGTVPKKVAWKQNKEMGDHVGAETSRENFSKELIQKCRAQLADMPTAISDVIDRDKWEAQIDKAEKGNLGQQYKRHFQKTARAFSWLDAWLADQ